MTLPDGHQPACLQQLNSASQVLRPIKHAINFLVVLRSLISSLLLLFSSRMSSSATPNKRSTVELPDVSQTIDQRYDLLLAMSTFISASICGIFSISSAVLARLNALATVRSHLQEFATEKLPTDEAACQHTSEQPLDLLCDPSDESSSVFEERRMATLCKFIGDPTEITRAEQVR